MERFIRCTTKKYKILKALYEKGPLNEYELAQEMGLSPTYVWTLVSSYIRTGDVRHGVDDKFYITERGIEWLQECSKKKGWPL